MCITFGGADKVCLISQLTMEDDLNPRVAPQMGWLITIAVAHKQNLALSVPGKMLDLRR